LSAKYQRPSVWKNTAGAKVPFMKVRWFNYGVGERADGTLEAHPDEVWYRLSLKTDEPWSKIRLRRRAAAVGVIDDGKYDLHSGPLSLPPKKVKDLAKFKAWLPREFHALYPDAPAANNKDEKAGEDDDSEEDEDGEGGDEDEEEKNSEDDDDDEEEKKQKQDSDDNEGEEEEAEQIEAEQLEEEDEDGDIRMTPTQVVQ
jgi:hypothetical protein